MQSAAKPQVSASSPLEADAPWKGWRKAGIAYDSSQNEDSKIGLSAPAITSITTSKPFQKELERRLIERLIDALAPHQTAAGLQADPARDETEVIQPAGLVELLGQMADQPAAEPDDHDLERTEAFTKSALAACARYSKEANKLAARHDRFRSEFGDALIDDWAQKQLEERAEPAAEPAAEPS